MFENVLEWSYSFRMGTFVMFWPGDLAKNAIQVDAPEGSDTF